MGEDRSWIKAYRSMMDKTAIWDSDCMTRLWLHCCFTANWKDTEWTIPATYQKIVVPRGSFITGRQALHAKLYRAKDENGFVIHHDFIPSESTLWRRIQALEKMGCLKIENVNNRCSMLTVVNYDTYQNVEQPFEQATDGRLNKRTLEREQPIDTSEEFKNLRIEERKKENGVSFLQKDVQIQDQVEYQKQADRLTGFSPIVGHLCQGFIRAYPRKIKPALVPDSFDSAIVILVQRGMTIGESAAFLESQATKYAASPAGRDFDGSVDVRPAPSKWLDEGRYDEDPNEWRVPNGNVRQHDVHQKPRIKPLQKKETA
jgi:hypothetical protein